MIKNTCAIVVTYNTGQSYLPNFLAIVSQVDHIFIVDNASNPETIALLENLKNNFANLTVLYNDKNLGLATAQNIGIDHAMNNGYDWILFLDDDSRADSKMISVMKKFEENYANNDKLGAMVPYIVEFIMLREQIYFCLTRIFFKLKQSFKKRNTLSLYFAIASGSLIKSSVFEKIGKFKDNFFIDYIDIEYGLRMTHAGYETIALKDAVLHHCLGYKKLHKFLGVSIITLNHNHIRKYYIFRNRIRVWKMYFFKFPNFIIYDILTSIYFFIKTLVFEDNKWVKFRSMVKGIKDGLINKP